MPPKWKRKFLGPLPPSRIVGGVGMPTAPVCTEPLSETSPRRSRGRPAKTLLTKERRARKTLERGTVPDPGPRHLEESPRCSGGCGIVRNRGRERERFVSRTRSQSLMVPNRNGSRAGNRFRLSIPVDVSDRVSRRASGECSVGTDPILSDIDGKMENGFGSRSGGVRGQPRGRRWRQERRADGRRARDQGRRIRARLLWMYLVSVCLSVAKK
mmetsp:Transcript_38762/g.90126  ORF Transcript_38762/g.90126 Transcript_38762/m.90126 type:complete len:213 (+) Transcript_38762:1969-2607(+)